METTVTQISAAEVTKLRSLTGAGMMDCKKALTEAQGDLEKAIEFLRKKGQKVSASRAEKEAKEGAVFTGINSSGNEGFVIELNCETDFVARNVDFIGLGKNILSLLNHNHPKNTDELKSLPLNGKSVNDHLFDLMAKIGEKIEIRTYRCLHGEKVVSYTHMGSKIGVLVALKNAEGCDVSEAAKDVAMQVAAMKPVAVDKEDVRAETLQKELEIAKEQARNEGKPEAMLEKIAQGRLTKFYKEATLLNQDFVKDSSLTVRQMLEKVKKGLTVSEFVRVALGG
ncbi:MAG: translation elongation factor Ts [Bacteroidetes bacterium RIFCSPLOWO2_02_FULL_36_8]|nr:MAG: translation elongation factor Ts [Bacteroidetes bacterium RIFCSPLOWO2_02_FULL_36_8]OFY69650.1 MAG: translation elongation factor Ts [Bacteroidetes bacterium RIFCSPLOWO2_12_FULL_37_12]